MPLQKMYVWNLVIMKHYKFHMKEHSTVLEHTLERFKVMKVSERLGIYSRLKDMKRHHK